VKDPRIAPLLLALVAMHTTACAGATCRKTRAAFDDFEARPATQTEPHARLTIPHRTLDLLLAGHARTLPSVQVPMPEISGMSIGEVRAVVEGIKSRAAAPGTLGLSVQVGLKYGNRTIMGFELDADLRPTVDAADNTVLVPLRGEDLRGVRPRTGPGGAKALVDVVYAQLPAAARAMIDKNDVAATIAPIVDDLTGSATQKLLASIGKQVGTIAEVELDLGTLPVKDVRLSSTPDAVVLGIVTPLPIATAMPLAADPAAPQTAALRLSGEAVTELVNHALRTGLVPERYDDEGESSPTGRWTARLHWQAGAQPLRLHLWCLQDACARVELAATPQVGLADGHVEFRTNDARIAKVEGSAKLRAAIVFSGLGRRTFAHVEQLATSFAFDVGDEAIAARVSDVQQHGDEVVLTLAVQPPPARPPRRRT